MTIVFTGWLLLVAGTGHSHSAPFPLHTYTTEAQCNEDGKKIKNAFWYVHYYCLKVENYQK